MSGLITVSPDTFDTYLKQINAFDLLSREEEFQIATRLRRQNTLEDAQRLICANLRFVVKIAQEYRNYGFTMADLVQEGNIGLMMAVRKFDPDRGLRLITYAVWWIRAYIHNYIIRTWSLVKIGTTQAQKRLFFKLNQTKERFRQLTGGEQTTAAEIADELAVSDEEVESMAVRMSGRDLSLDVPLVEGENYTLLDTLSDERSDQEQILMQHQDESLRGSAIKGALAMLNEREQLIIEKRLLCEPPLTLQELAESYGISRERVRQIEANALKKMRNHLADCGAEPEELL